MRTRKAVRLAEKIDRIVAWRSVTLSTPTTMYSVMYVPSQLRSERDLLVEVATELRRLAAKQGAKK